MSSAPSDLLELRNNVLSITGLSGDSVGIVANQAHLSNGGYHCGVQDIKNIGKYPNDYSVSHVRDRVGNNVASALDVGDDWPHGGRDAWLRWNNLMVHEMLTDPTALYGLRGMNFSPDGTARKRLDLAHPGDGVINSTDTVTIHTHLEWWRDTVSRRPFGRILELMHWAIDGAPVPITHKGGDANVSLYTAVKVPANTVDCTGVEVVENTRVTCTPHGVFAFEYGEIIAEYKVDPAVFLPVAWPRLLLLCEKLQQPVPTV